MARAGRGLLDVIFPLLFPDDCRVCGDPLPGSSRIPVCRVCLADPKPLEAEFFCSECKTAFVNRAPLDEQGRCALCRLGLKGFDAAYTFGSYEGTLRSLVHLFKYENMQPLARAFGSMLARALPRETSFDVIVPMPLHWLKRWRRGFNQAELLAREISRVWQVPVKNVARRKKYTATQAGLTNAKRRENVQGAFHIPARFKELLSGKHILLVDDVMTTGATASACARALKRAGAARITLLTLARTDRRIAMDLSTHLTSQGAKA
ncbi:MAG: ComF family protein [Acidobacteriota bacterium]